MRSFSTLLAVAATIPAAFAHYNFEALIVNGNQTQPYEFVRQTTNANSPITDVTSDDIICNQGGLDADIRAKTGTYTVQPGDEVGFTVNSELGHPGPLAVYMSKAPDGTETSDYLGDGKWFKVYELSTSSITDAGLQWATYVNNAGIHNFTFTLPDALPKGNYLMRAEHIGLHGAGEKGGAQFYIGCAQLAVGGSGTGSPSPTVDFPGAYDGSEPGVLINIYYPAPTSYTAPGPVTWPNKCEDHTPNLDGQKSDGDCTGSDGSEAGGDDSSSETPVASAPAVSSTPLASATPVIPEPVASTPAVSSPAATATAVAVSSAPAEAPAATSTAAAEAPAATSSAAPVASPSTCAEKRAIRKAKRAARLAAKRAL